VTGIDVHILLRFAEDVTPRDSEIIRSGGSVYHQPDGIIIITPAIYRLLRKHGHYAKMLWAIDIYFLIQGQTGFKN